MVKTKYKEPNKDCLNTHKAKEKKDKQDKK